MDTNNTAVDRNGEGGSLIVQVLTAGGALPLAGASVTISDAGDGWISEEIRLTTESAGLTERVPLPAPPKDMSLSPTVRLPYARYNINVTYPGHIPYNAKNVPVFSGVNSRQTVNMIPFSSFDKEETYPRFPDTDGSGENSLLLSPDTNEE